MANRYRKNKMTSRPLKGGRYGNPSSNIWLWLLTGMFVGILGAALIYMMLAGGSTANKLKHLAQANTVSKSNSMHSNTKPKANVQPIAQKKEPIQQFEFYNILPGMEVKTNVPTNTATASKKIEAKAPIATVVKAKPSTIAVTQANSTDKTAIKTKSTNKTPAKLFAANYLVQVGLFRHLNQADQLKATLTLQGFTPSIQKLQAQDGAWFRVAIGPFSSQSLAQKEKSRLEKQKIHGVLVLQGQ
jgi:cell division protein FtsN